MMFLKAALFDRWRTKAETETSKDGASEMFNCHFERKATFNQRRRS